MLHAMQRAIALMTILAAAQPAVAAPFSHTTLENGLQVFVATTPAAPRTAIALTSTVSRDDMPCDLAQLPHLVEHLAFEPLEHGDLAGKRPDQVFNDNAGYLNASTTPSSMHFHGRVHSQYTRQALGALGAAVVYRPAIAKAVDRERTLVMKELGRSKFNAWLGNASPLLKRLVGRISPEDCRWDLSLREMSASHVESHWKDIFDPRNMSLFVATDLPRDDVLPMVTAAFGAVPQAGTWVSADRPAIIANEPVRQVRLATGRGTIVGAVIYIFGRDETPATARIITKLLDAQAFDKLRQQKGLAYKVSAEYSAVDRAITVLAEPSAEDAEIALEAIKEVVGSALRVEDPEAFERARHAVALEMESFSEQPEVNVAYASGREVGLRSGMDPVAFDTTQMMTAEQYRTFIDNWLDGEPVYFIETRVGDHLPPWAFLVPIIVLAILAIAKRARRKP